MAQRAFWRLIDRLEASLLALPPEESISFAEVYDGYRHRACSRRLWGAAYLINGGCSDDGFEYFRGWLISRGEQVHEAALVDPGSLASFVSGEDLELEALLYAPLRAYERQVGKPMPSFKQPYPELGGPEWGEEALESLFPRIARKLVST